MHCALSHSTGSPISAAQDRPPSGVEDPLLPRALSTSVFGFETILTGLVYLSFGIFLYQMIQRAVDAQVLNSLTLPSGGRSASQFDVPTLLQSIEEVGNYFGFRINLILFSQIIFSFAAPSFNHRYVKYIFSPSHNHCTPWWWDPCINYLNIHLAEAVSLQNNLHKWFSNIFSSFYQYLKSDRFELLIRKILLLTFCSVKLITQKKFT